MGKTWEAVAAAALVLYKQRPRGLRHVLVLCPANLITKWEDELARGSKLGEKVADWGKGKNGSHAQRVVETLQQVFPVRRSKHVATRKHRSRFRPEGGTYLVSHGLITRKGHGLAALRRHPWDVIIVDEAHQALARKALAAVETHHRARAKILLSATPFQLEPRQWNSVARHIVKGNERIFSRPELRDYTERVAAVFQDPTERGPSRGQVESASATLRKIAVRSAPARARRSYAFLLPEGRELPLKTRLDRLDDQAVRNQLAALRAAFGVDQEFERAYLGARYQLALNPDRSYVATALRRQLSMGYKEAPSPRLRALGQFARVRLQEDMQRALDSGCPQKTIVFTAWVGPPKTGESARLREVLGEAFSSALAEFRRLHASRWSLWHAAGRSRLQGGEFDDILRWLAKDELTCVLCGARPAFEARLRENLKDRHASVLDIETRRDALEDRSGVEARALRRRRADMLAGLNPWRGRRELSPVECYTGQDTRVERDRAASAFREVGPPWVLVASQVGAEGIDLQVYTRRIIHYDLEWNPARMEQREGRGDRVGRLLDDDLSILYCIVPGTYDERMFHQLVARDRWHGVLLGKPAQTLEDDAKEAPLLAREQFAAMRLSLEPR